MRSIPGCDDVKTLVSWSSGKDSAWMVHVLKQRGCLDRRAAHHDQRTGATGGYMHAVRVAVLAGAG